MGFHRMADVRLILLFVFLFLIGNVIPKAYGLTAEEEKSLGKKIFSEIEQSGAILNDLILQGFVDTVGKSLVAEIGPSPFEFKFYLVKSQEPNAFAIPGGYVFATTGLFVMAENEQEIAGVLSHEIAHVTMRHISRAIDRSKRINIATMAAMIAGMILAGGGKGSEAIAATAMATQAALALKYTRENETDADQNSLRYLVNAGYDPSGLVSFMKKISRYSLTASPKVPTYLSSHPAAEDRISLMENLIQIEPKKPVPVKTVGNYKWIQTRAFVNEREPHVAVSHFESVVKGNPEDPVGMYGLGIAYEKMGRLDKSIEVFQKALSVEPKDPDLLRELGVSYFLSGRLDQSIETLEWVRALSRKDDAMALYYLGRAYLEKGDLSKALDLLTKVWKAMPDFPEVNHSLGSVYGRMGRQGQSHFFFGKYFKLRGDRGSALLHFRTALETLDRGSPEREEVQQEIKELTPGRP